MTMKRHTNCWDNNEETIIIGLTDIEETYDLTMVKNINYWDDSGENNYWVNNTPLWSAHILIIEMIAEKHTKYWDDKLWRDILVIVTPINTGIIQIIGLIVEG